MNWIAKHLLSACLLPPLNLILLGTAGILLLRSKPALGKRLVSLTLLLLYVISTPFFSDWALRKFEGPYVAPAGKTDAIVVLGGGSYFHAPEYGNRNTVSSSALVRLRYAAHLYRETGEPILVTGGHPLGNSDSEASAMKTILVEDFHVPVQWTEDESVDTEGNAFLSARILERSHVRKISLVTDAWHMPRSALLFRHAGLEVVPAPTGFTTHYRTDVLSFVPSAEALRNSEILMHEILGIAWFELKS